MVQNGAIPCFVRLLGSDSQNVCEQAVWALGNVAGDGAAMRDLVIESGAVKPLLALLADAANKTAGGLGASEETAATLTFLRNVTWSVSNLCRNKTPDPPLSVMKQMLPSLVQLLSHPDSETQTDACWALSYLSDGNNEKIQEVVDAGAVPALTQKLACANLALVTPSLRALGNIVTGSETN